MGFFDKENENVNAEPTEAADNNVVQMPDRKPFQVWDVDGKKYRLKLDTAGISELEQKYKTNLMNVMGSGNGGMPALTVMLDVAHVAMQKFQHGIKRGELNELFDKYVEQGGSQLSFYTEIYMGIFTASGFFSTSLAQEMDTAVEKASQELK